MQNEEQSGESKFSFISIFQKYQHKTQKYLDVQNVDMFRESRFSEGLKECCIYIHPICERAMSTEHKSMMLNVKIASLNTQMLFTLVRFHFQMFCCGYAWCSHHSTNEN